MNSKVKIICSKSQPLLAREFFNELRGSIHERPLSNDYLIITPNAKSGADIISVLLQAPTLNGSFIKSSFETIKTLSHDITRELSPETILINKTCAHEILKEIVRENKGSLSFAALSESTGLYNNLYRLIMKFKENGYLSGGHGSVTNKIPHGNNVFRSFLLVYEKYNEYLKERNCFDEADEFTFARANFGSSKIVSKVKDLFIIGFVHFSKFEEDFIFGLLGHFDDSRLYALRDDNSENSSSHLNRFIDKIRGSFESEVIALPVDKEGPENNLDYLKKNIFVSYQGKKEVQPDDESVNVIATLGIEDEVRYLAAKVSSLIKTGDCRPGEIAVIVRDREEYSDEIKRTFNRFGIPVDIKSKQSIMNLNIIKTAMLPLFIVRDDFLRDDVISFLGSNYIDTGGDIDIDQVELALMKAGIIKGAKSYNSKLDKLNRSNKVKDNVKEITEFIDGFIGNLSRRIKFHDTVSNYKRSLLSILEDTYKIKEQIVKHLFDVKPELIKRDVFAITEFKSAFDELVSAYEFSGKKDMNIRVDQLIDELTMQLNSRSISVDEKVSYSKNGVTFDEEIQFFTPEEFFIKSYKTVFVLGVNDGSYPRNELQSFLLGGTGAALEFLTKKDDALQNEKQYFRRILSLCNKKLYLTYIGDNSIAAGAASPKGRSPYIDDVLILLGSVGANTHIEKASINGLAETSNEAVCCDDLVIDLFSTVSSETTDHKKELFNLLIDRADEYGHVMRAMSNVVIEHDRKRLDDFTDYEGNLFYASDTFKDEFREKIEGRTFSASQLDTFANCRISYFFSKVLYLILIEAPELGMHAKDKGTILHEILNRYFTSADESLLICENRLSPTELEERITRETKRIEDITDTYFGEMHDIVATMNPHMIEIEKASIKNTLKSVVRYEIVRKDEAFETLQKAQRKYDDEYKKSAKNRAKGKISKNFTLAEDRLNKAKRNQFFFRPAYFEFGFGAKKSDKTDDPSSSRDTGDFREVSINLSSESDEDKVNIFMRGFIDRIDVNDELNEFIVIDYKSGRTPKEKDVKEGRSFQLPLYEEYVQKELLKGSKPACGIYYALNEKNNKKKEIKVTYEQVRPYLLKNYQRILSGEFFVLPNEHCRSYCDFPSICRYEEDNEG